MPQIRPFLSRIAHAWLWATGILFLGCAHETLDTDGVKPVDVAPNKSDAEQEPSAIAEDEASVQFDKAFCPDDIYSRYLSKQFLADKKVKAKSKKAQRFARIEALHYARHVLEGPATSYSGSIPVVQDPLVEHWVDYFNAEGRSTFLLWLVRAQKFRPVLEPLLAKEGMPPELFFVAMAESGFSNNAASRVRATGTWQFMKETAKRYGLRIDYWVDERRDPVKSTVAAARFLRDLYIQFGDWHLAMAAYNAGPGKIRSAIRRSGSKDYWTIAKKNYLKTETKYYVPKILAALKLYDQAKQNGFAVKETEIEEQIVPTTALEMPYPVALSDIGQLLQVSTQTLRQWNPELNQDFTPPQRLRQAKGYELRLPPAYIQAAKDQINSLRKIEISDVSYHRVAAGETLTKIAKRYNVKLAEIRELNPSLRATALRVGREVLVPVPSYQ